ncbi:immunoglobulin-like domain-containing protein [Paenibacillus hexagrammi]|uniref:DUF5011 domain-containing protein n=1 Tax=Paenibacillus hexagrammi TaxID=2908839 RepID=A0ABY3SIQ3_9BACL|nr:immunoglobulin-like domain-containing protein [Paenibacillus sp. YPD9-1]UJF33604.1 DUF5011 domain-containing protein [Paenibacillus sp. YPD9-1]
MQASADAAGTLVSDAVPASILVSEANDAPEAYDDTLTTVAKGTSLVAIPYGNVTVNDIVGPTDEQSWQTLTITAVQSITGGTVQLANGQIEFSPDPTFMGNAQFSYTVEDNGRTDGMDDPKTATATASFAIADEEKPELTLNGDETLYLLQGESYQEPGYSANDETDSDLTDRVVVTGSVDTSTLGTYELHYNVQDNSNNAAIEKVRTVKVISKKLTSLAVETKTLTPSFDRDQESYSLTVPSSKGTVTISAGSEDPTATVSINGEVTESKAINLNVGTNSITLVVTAKAGPQSFIRLTSHAKPPMKPSRSLAGLLKEKRTITM